MIHRVLILSIFAVTSAFLILSSAAQSFAQSSTTGKVTGYPVPRFVTLKAETVNMRVGPGTEFPIEWTYKKKGLPVEIIQEFDLWRKIRDAEGAEGWVSHTLLSGRRNAIVNPGEEDKVKGLIDLKSSPENSAETVARMEPGVVVVLKSCDLEWCEVEVNDTTGYVAKVSIWGIYPDERYEG
ncbi:MAG: SH3 domain-containing protein [Pseudomonadota bacterium]